MSHFAASSIADRAEQALAPAVAAAGYELLLCEWTGGGGQPTLWVYIERTDEEPVGIEDCQVVHDAVTDLLDAEDLIPTAYTLNISSPGLERPLKRASHYEDVLGEDIAVRTWEPIEGRRNWKGRLSSMEEDVITVVVDGAEHRIPLPAIERAKLVYTPPEKGQKKGGSTRKKRSGR